MERGRHARWTGNAQGWEMLVVQRMRGGVWESSREEKATSEAKEVERDKAAAVRDKDHSFLTSDSTRWALIYRGRAV